MANSPDLAFQKVIAAALTSVVPTVNRGANPPHSQALPYIWYGESEIEPDVPGPNVTITLNFYSKANGPHEVKQHMQLVRDQLHLTGASQDGWTLVCIQEVFSDTVHDIDNQYWHGIMRMRCLASLE